MKLTLNEVERRYKKLFHNKEQYEKRFNLQLKFIQKYCPHKDPKGDTTFKYVPDSSGNNDSYYQCLFCNVIRKRIEDSE